MFGAIRRADAWVLRRVVAPAVEWTGRDAVYMAHMIAALAMATMAAGFAFAIVTGFRSDALFWFGVGFFSAGFGIYAYLLATRSDEVNWVASMRFPDGSDVVAQLSIGGPDDFGRATWALAFFASLVLGVIEPNETAARYTLTVGAFLMLVSKYVSLVGVGDDE